MGNNLKCHMGEIQEEIIEEPLIIDLEALKLNDLILFPSTLP